MSYFKYEFDSTSGILYKYYFGEITLQDITDSWDESIRDKLIPENTKGFILDYRNATFKISIAEYPEIANYYKRHLEVFGNKRIAILTENPKDVIIPMLVEEQDEGYESKPFSTLDAATRWVLDGR